MVGFSKPSTSESSIEEENSSLFSKLTDKVVTFIIEKLLNGVRLNTSLMARVGAIASGMISFFSGIATAFSFAKYAKGASKFVLYLTPISSLTTLVLDIYSLLFDVGLMGVVQDKFKDFISCIKDNISRVVSVITDNVNKISFLKKNSDPDVVELKEILSDGGNEIQSNALSPTQQIGLATSLLTLVFVSGASCIGWKIAEINNFLRLRMLSFSTAREFKAAIVEILEDLGIYDVSGKASIIHDVESVLETAHTLRFTAVADFVLDASKFASLIDVIKTIKDIQKRALNTEVKKAIQQHLAKLDKEYNALLSVYKQIQDLLSEHQRQNCVGVILEGDGGIGKSHFAKWLLTQVGKRLGYGQAIYDASRGSSKRFNKPYAFQSLGIMNEFAAQRTEDMDYLEDINKILSSDPFGFESASEELKYQPCQLKLVVFTSNAQQYDFSRKMTEGSNMALMSRFIRVQVRDKDYVADRNDIQGHRRPDYSHLECQIVAPKVAPCSLADYWNLKAAPIEAKKLVDYLVPIIAMHETNHIFSLIEETKDNPKYAEAMGKRIEQLKEISSQCDKFEPVFGAYKSFHGTSGNKEKIHKNAHEPLIFHFAGPPGVGKSVSAQNIAHKLRRLYNLEVKICDQNDITALPKNTVYIIDDYPFHDHDCAQKYLDLTNNMTNHSMIIITTNHPFQTYIPRSGPLQYMFKWAIWAKTGIWDIPNPSLIPGSYWDKVFADTPGLVRRVGMPFNCEKFGYTPRTSQCYVELNRMGLPKIISPSSETSTVQNVCDAYTKFVQTQREIMIVDSLPLISEFDIDIDLVDIEEAIPLLSSTSGLYQLLTGHRAGRLRVNEASAMGKCPAGLIAEWLLPKVEPGTSHLDIAKAYAERIKLVCPTMTFKLTIPGAAVYYHDGILYASNCDERHVVVQDGTMYVFGARFLPSEFARFYLNPQVFVSVNSDYNFIQLETAKIFYDDHKKDLPLYGEAIDHLSKAGSWQHKFRAVIDFLCTNTGVKIIAWIFGIVSVLGLAKICYDYFCGPVKSNVVSNGGPATPSPSSDAYERWYKMTESESKAMRSKAQERVKQVNWREHSEPEGYPPRSNAVPPTSPTKQGLEAALECDYSLEPYLALTAQLPPKLRDYLRASPNAVPPEFENLKVETAFSSAVKKIKKNFCKFSGKLNCYGIFLCKQLCVVPCHAIDIENPENNCVYWAPSEDAEPQRFSVKILAYTTAKDVALVRAFKAPNMKDITSLLPKGVTTSWSATACYVRPLAHTEMCWGVAHYNPTKALPLGDEPMFHAIDYIHFDQITFGARAIYQRGDCGMPLIGLINNEAVLLGFHIALNNNDEGWFSPLSREDVEHVERIFANGNSVPFCCAPGFERHADVPSWNAVLSSLKKENPISSHPEIPVLGTFNSNFNITPRPDRKRVWFYDEEKPLNFRLDTGHAPILPRSLCEEARALLPKLDNGEPSPLLAQTKKYFVAEPFTAQGDAFDIAVWAQSEMLQQVCGVNNKPLRMHEVINGILGASLKRLEWDSSAGPHMKYFFNIHKKEVLFKQTQDNPPVWGINLDTEAGARLLEDYKMILECWSHGRPVAVLIKDNPKVEVVGEEDIAVGKVRLFCEMDLALNMALRRFFGAVFNKLGEATLEAPWKTAWNPYICPDRIVNSENPNFTIICFDVKRMDKNLAAVFTRVMCQQVNKCFAESCEVDFKAIADSMTQAIHVQGEIVYTQEGGNHSGSYLTTPLNTLSCHLAVLVAFIERYHELYQRYPSLRVIRAWMTFAGCGDDGRATFHPDLKMTFEYLAAAFKRCGLEIVENKNTHEHTELGELCSRVFRRMEGSNTVIGCLKKRSILKTIHWCKKSAINQYVEQCALAIFEASFWEESFFDKVVEDAKRLIQRKGLALNTLSIAPYKMYRDHLEKYIKGYVSSPVVTSTGSDMFAACYRDKQAVSIYLNAVYEYFERFPTNQRDVRESTSFDKVSGIWTVTVCDSGFSGVGSSPFASAARGLAYQKLLSSRVPELSSSTHC